MLTGLLLVVAGVLVVGLLLNSLALWLACKVFRVRYPDRSAGVGFGRAIGLTLLISLVQSLLSGGAYALQNEWASLAALALQLLLPIVVLRLTLPVGLLRALGIDVLWAILSGVGVVLLVLVLRLLVFEGFLIPSGGMAETVYGYHKKVACPSCGFELTVNASDEGAPLDGRGRFVSECTCPNCRLRVDLAMPQLPGNARGDQQARPANRVADPGLRSGDRLLIGKGILGASTIPPERFDLLVFEYPGEQEPRFAPNPAAPVRPILYLQRLIGKPGETLAIHRGKLFLLPPEKAKELGLYHDDKDDNGEADRPSGLWRPFFMHRNDEPALKAFAEGKFKILRKPARLVESMGRLVHDNDYQASDLAGPEAKRWQPADRSGWAEERTSFRHDGSGDEVGWLRYRHVLRGQEKPALITDFTSYNTFHLPGPQENWASDLSVECDVEVKQASDTFAMEVSRGDDRFRATFDLASGECVLSRITDARGHEKSDELKKAPTHVKGKGRYRLRFANVDDRLLVWADGRLPFGDGVHYDATQPIVPTRGNDLERPVSIGARADVVVSHLRVYRDVYFTAAQHGDPSAADVPLFGERGEPTSFDAWKQAPVSTYFVQPGHYFCLGDNSPASSDSRLWGLVAHERVKGKALLRYYPFVRVGWIE